MQLSRPAVLGAGAAAMPCAQISGQAWIAALESVKILQARPALTLPSLIHELAAVHADKPALLGQHATLSYRDLSERAHRYASWAAAIGISAGDTVCLMMPNCPDYFAIWVGITQLGRHRCAFKYQSAWRWAGAQHHYRRVRADYCRRLFVARHRRDSAALTAYSTALGPRRTRIHPTGRKCGAAQVAQPNLCSGHPATRRC